jgi:hypothetical protein
VQITITSGGVAALCAFMTMFGGFLLWLVKLLIAADIRKLNGQYIRANGSQSTGHEYDRLEALESVALVPEPLVQKRIGFVPPIEDAGEEDASAGVVLQLSLGFWHGRSFYSG